MAVKADVDNPLTSKDYTDIQRALELLTRHRIKAENAKRAGFDVDDDILLNDTLREKFGLIKQTFFPKKP
jgi:hypothetical protein